MSDNMMRPHTILSGLLSLSILGCAQVIDDGDSSSLYKNANPEIEALHVKAYNYDLGIGVPQDRVKANQLYLQAAKAGDPRSMMNYAMNRYNGVGIVRDPVDAYYWIDKARFATQHTPDMKMKWRIRVVHDEIRKSLTPTQREAALKKHRQEY
jgi:hypothetical protein